MKVRQHKKSVIVFFVLFPLFISKSNNKNHLKIAKNS